MGRTVAAALLGGDPLISSEGADTISYMRNIVNQPVVPNQGVTWFGSSYVGPGNFLADAHGKFIGNTVPTTAIDKVAFQHDADYYNATNTSKDNI